MWSTGHHLMWRADSSGLYPDARKDSGQEEKGATEDETIGWHRWHNGHGLDQAPGDSEGQGSLACCNSWGPKKLDMTERLGPMCVWKRERKEREIFISLSKRRNHIYQSQLIETEIFFPTNLLSNSFSLYKTKYRWWNVCMLSLGKMLMLLFCTHKHTKLN